MARFYAIIVEDLGKPNYLSGPESLLNHPGISLPTGCSIHAAVELDEHEVLDLTADMRAEVMTGEAR